MSRDLTHLRPAFIVVILLVLQGIPSFARDYVFQNSNTEQKTSVQVQNKTKEVQPVWVLFYQDEFIEEHGFEIPANSVRTLNLDGLKKPLWNFAVLTKSLAVQPVGSPVSDQANWEWSPATRFEMKLKPTQELSLQFFNLYVEKQKVSLTYLNPHSEVVQKTEFHTASFRRNLSRNEIIPAGATRLVIESEAPIQVSSKEIIKPVIDGSRTVTSDFKYFLVQNGIGGTNFVAPIDDPALIRLARKEILDPQGYMVFADIELNKNQANRNFSSPEKAYWSWSIKKVTGMAQVGADWCQAYPEMIERMLHGFLRQESVCFRGQRIIRELKPSEVQSGQLNN